MRYRSKHSEEPMGGRYGDRFSSQIGKEGRGGEEKRRGEERSGDNEASRRAEPAE
jgi:hypothetical protein